MSYVTGIAAVGVGVGQLELGHGVTPAVAALVPLDLEVPPKEAGGHVADLDGEEASGSSMARADAANGKGLEGTVGARAAASFLRTQDGDLEGVGCAEGSREG